jgi:Fur family zinc uptake transcriptional regulator
MARSAAAAKRPAPPAFVAPRHNHESCVDTALDRASALCVKHGTRLTDLRREVLALVWQGHEPVGAYDVLDALRRRHPGAAPPTVYRALEFLIAEGLIHRIESLNAYVGCSRPDEPHVSQFLICERCNTTAELGDPTIRSAASARTAGGPQNSIADGAAHLLQIHGASFDS